MVKRVKVDNEFYAAERIVCFGVHDVEDGEWPHIYFMLDTGAKITFGRNFYDKPMAEDFARNFMKELQESDEEELDLFFDF